MNNKKNKRINFLYYISVIFFVLIILGPIAWAIIVSFTPEYEMFKNTSYFLPKEPTMDNYIKIFTASSRQSKMFFIGVINSVKTAFITILQSYFSVFKDCPILTECYDIRYFLHP